MDYLSKDQLGSLMAVLIAQLQRNNILSVDDFDTMRRRLTDAGDAEVVKALNDVLLSDLIDDPDRRRASLYVIADRDKTTESDGGNRED